MYKEKKARNLWPFEVPNFQNRSLFKEKKQHSIKLEIILGGVNIPHPKHKKKFPISTVFKCNKKKSIKKSAKKKK